MCATASPRPTHTISTANAFGTQKLSKACAKAAQQERAEAAKLDKYR
jgi:hypothetical protein